LKIATNKKFQNIIESISKIERKQKVNATQKVKKVMRSMLVAVAIPILLPLWIILVLSTITVQGMLSRRRVQKILAIKIKNSNNDDYSLSNHIGINVRAANIEDEAVETAMNIKNFLTPSPTKTSNLNPFENATQISEFTTSSQFSHVKVCKAQCEAFVNLNKLRWDKIAVFLDAFNAHAAIVMRNRFQTTGKEIIKHFVEETFIV
jgi:Na+-translocating ferredoxin:NAD+ oxidoreductase RnfD subunit